MSVTAGPGRLAADSPPRQQHPLWVSVVLHLFPGAALTGFVLLVTPALGGEVFLAFLIGIVVVLAPLELGYLTIHAKRTTGSWALLQAVDYRATVPWKRLALFAVGLAVWMLVLVALALVFLDEWLAGSVFAWVPETLLAMSTVGGDEEMLSTAGLVGFLVLFFVTNGVIGPISEELYFRGHLLPRIDRFGGAAPVLNTVLFTIYHFHTPWRYPVILLGYLPIAWLSWRKRSVWVGLAAHMVVNNVFVLMMLGTYLAGA